MPDQPPAFDLAASAAAVMRENGFQPDFPALVEQELSGIRELTPGRALAGRVRDLRAELWSSIDNRSSRDLDQVEVATALPGDVIRLSIGIADVDELVPRDSAIDRHAAKNTTSVYTGVAVFPMLPEKLSTDLTSLNEGEDRLAVVIEMDVAADGAMVREDVYRALLRNHAKLEYESVGAWLEENGPLPARVRQIPGLEAQLRLQHEASRRLRAVRERAGALSLESVEARPVVVNGRVVDIVKVETNRARDLIESYMVAANGVMARFLDRRRTPSIRRVVRTPRRWSRLVQLAQEMGASLPVEPDPRALAAFVAGQRAADPERFPDFSLSVVKLLGPGEYVLERRMDTGRRDGYGHFGLAVAEYTHSTAPNRRFVDLVTQRLAKDADTGNGAPYSDVELTEIARRCTDMEDAARKVERAMRKKAAAVLIGDRIGERFTAVVTGASAKGTYVRVLSPPVEGRVVRGGRALDVGDTVRVTLLVADPERGFIDFAADEQELDRKLERTRRKRAAAAAIRPRLGDQFDAEVTGASEKGTWIRLLELPVEGRVMRGYKGLTVGQRVRVTLVGADPVHGFIDFEFGEGVTPQKRERQARKQRAAAELRERVGERFDAVVTGVTPKAVWARLGAPDVEARIVRGGRSLGVGDRTPVLLLVADPVRGHIDVAVE